MTNETQRKASSVRVFNSHVEAVKFIQTQSDAPHWSVRAAKGCHKWIAELFLPAPLTMAPESYADKQRNAQRAQSLANDFAKLDAQTAESTCAKVDFRELFSGAGFNGTC